MSSLVLTMAVPTANFNALLQHLITGWGLSRRVCDFSAFLGDSLKVTLLLMEQQISARAINSLACLHVQFF